PDGVQLDRNVARQAARLEITAVTTAKEKSPAAMAGLFISKCRFRSDPKTLVRGRVELRGQAFVRLEGLLSEIGIEARDLLRLGDEGFVGRARKFGLRLERLVQRLHAGELLDKRLGVFERLLGVVAIGGSDRLNAALHVARRSGNRFEMLFAVVL